MKKCLLFVSSFSLFTILLLSNPPRVASETSYLAPHIDVCASSSCFNNCVCLTCNFTFYLYDSTNTLVDSCTGVYPWVLCCTIAGSSHPAGNYHFVLVIPGCLSCTGSVFYYDGTTASETVNCRNCSDSRKDGNNETPNTYSLAQNYPNPFNPTTSISFGLPKAGVVKLVIYDLSGKTIATLFDGYKEAGNYSAEFDASNIASGVYFYKLSIDGGAYSQIQKMVLIK